MKIDARKFDQAALWATLQASSADWRKLDTRSELGAAMKLATVRLHVAPPAAEPIVAYVEVIL